MCVPVHILVTIIVLISGVSFVSVVAQTSSLYAYPYVTPADCKENTTNGAAQFFDITQVRCTPCAQPTMFQTVSADGLHCICQVGYILTQNFGGAIQCAPCLAGEIASFSGWECVKCNDSNTASQVCTTCSGLSNQITVQRQLDGFYSPPGPTLSQTCESCVNETSPNAAGTQCVRCDQVLSMLGNTDAGCVCPSSLSASGLCFASTTPPFSVLATVNYGTGSLPVMSAYFNAYAAGAVTMCLAPYYNQTACELLGNLCTLILYNAPSPPGNPPNVCNYYQQGSGTVNWPPTMPWLYYFSPTASVVLSDTGIPTAFTFPNTLINFRVGMYALNGSFLGYRPVTNGLLQLCKNTDTYMNAAYDFGTYFTQSCTMPENNFWDELKYPPVFFDMWLEYTLSTGAPMLYAVPILISNYVNPSGQSDNTGSDNTKWQLVRRFFLVDNIAGKTDSGLANPALAVRYAQSITINIKLQNGQSSGFIYPPYVQINYATAALGNNGTASLSFQVVYSMTYTSFQTGVSIAVAVLASLSLVYAVVRTWSWFKRGRHIAIDLPTLFKFILFSCGYVANSLFVVNLGASIFYLIFYKNQSTVLIVASMATEPLYITFLVIAFVFKLLDVLHVLFIQATVDIFFIDWERPDSRLKPTATAHFKHGDPPVSIWRTYFAANEWNEIQTTRQINPAFQIITTVFFLEIIGFGNLATADPHSNFQLNNSNQYYAPMNSMLRFALIGSVYLLTAFAQWLYFSLIHERFIDDPIRSYVDFCSTTNVSLLLLESDTYGYYIHGRTVHGRSDTGLREMAENMEREKKDLCGKRGLVPGTEEQTFRVALPSKLKSKYDRIIMPTQNLQQQGGAAVAGARARNSSRERGGGEAGLEPSVKLDPHMEMCIKAYGKLNTLMQEFIDHSLKDADYIVKEPVLLEQILDVEFHDPLPEMGFFYKDNGHSFDSLLFYGHELMFLIFEVLFFSLLDLGTNNYFFDGAMLYLLMEVFVKRGMMAFGRMNLAKKTLVDKRFLI